MANTSTWKTKCKVCGSPVYYYPAKLLLESVRTTNEDLKTRIVDCNCTGDTVSGKHTRPYEFPAEFTKIS